MISRNSLGICCALGAACAYGFVPNMVRGALENGVPPVESTLVRTSMVAVALSILAVLRSERLAVPRAAFASFAGQALATLVISVAYLASVQFIPVGLAVIIFFTFPVLIMLFAPAIEGHSPGLVRILIAVFAFAGLAVAVVPGLEKLDVRGIALAAAASAFCTLQFFSGRAISRHMPPAAFGALVHAVIWPATLLVALLAGRGTITTFPGGSIGGMGYAFMIAVGLMYVFAYLAQMLSLRFAAASVVAPFFNLEPIVTSGVAAFLLGERLAFNHYAGGTMVLAALAASGIAANMRAPAA